MSSAIDDKGTTLYAQLKHLKDTIGIEDPLLEPVTVPQSATWILETFWQLDRKRQYHGMSGEPLPISFTELLAYSKLKKVVFTQFDLDALDAMEEAYFIALYNLKKGRTNHE